MQHDISSNIISIKRRSGWADRRSPPTNLTILLIYLLHMTLKLTLPLSVEICGEVSVVTGFPVFVIACVVGRAATSVVGPWPWPYHTTLLRVLTRIVGRAH